MAIPIVLSFLIKMAAKVGIKKARQMVTKKYGKEALKNITKPKEKIKNITKPKEKIIKHQTELQRVKAQIKRDLAKKKTKADKFPKGKYKLVKAKDGSMVIVENKPTGYVIRNFRGKREPVYGKRIKPYKPYVPPKK